MPSHSQFPSLSSRRIRVGRWLGVLMDVCLGLVIVVVPPLMGGSFELAELYKQALLIGLVACALGAWTMKAALERRFEVGVSWLPMTCLGVAMGALMAGYVSIDRYASFVGQFSQRAWTVSSLLSLTLFACLLAQRIRKSTQVYNTLFLWLVGCVAVGVIGIWMVWTKQAWNPTGSGYALTLNMAAAAVVSLGLLLRSRTEKLDIFTTARFPGRLARVVAWLAVILSFTILFLVRFWLGWLGILMGMGVYVFFHLFARMHRTKRAGRSVWIPLVVAGVVLGFWFLPIPGKISLPGEVSLSMQASWQTVQRTLAARPVFGTGPSTWVYDHALYKAQVINTSPFWATRFDRATSSFLTMLATMGMVGTLLFLLCIFSCVYLSVRDMWRGYRDQRYDEEVLSRLILLAGWFVLLIFYLFYNFNLSHQVSFWTLTACLMGLATRRYTTIEARGGSWLAFVLPIKALVIGASALCVIIFVGQTVWAETKLVRLVNGYQSGQVTIHRLIEGISSIQAVYPWHDVSARILSQAYLVKVLDQVKDKPASEQARFVADDVTNLVNVALDAVQRNPAAAENWMNAGFVYAAIGPFTKDAWIFAQKNYREAWQRDPQNPLYPTEMGKVYVAQAKSLNPLLEAQDISIRERTAREIEAFLTQAVQLWQTALVLKSDYVPALDSLVLVFEQQGKLAEATALLEQMVKQEQTPERVFELGILYTRLGKVDQAVLAFEWVVDREPSSLKARFELVKLYEQVGRLREALEQLRIVAQGAPGNQAMEEKVRDLEKKVEKLN